ncbi:hypothetical protein [Pseudactinotalea suaedae]|uniref:hypothetical protein n=1 Tax=Pseudactinotalea suaedae TaxID=1524924 RepID=UPI0012E0D184|nr:hypothetical protein [Pseudactinotalea suaedae]
MTRSAVAALLALLTFVALAACTSEPDNEPEPARPLTSEEAQHLALVRFRNFDAGTRPVSFEVTDSGLTYVVEASVDFAAGLGYGLVSDPAGSETLLLGWSSTTVSTTPWAGGEPAPLPAPPVDESWTTSALSVEQSRLHATLAILLELGADRPDNALLLQQTDARWLRDDEVTIDSDSDSDSDSVAVSVIAGPTADVVYDPESGLPDDGSAATLRYWVDDTGVAHRVELRLGAGGDWTVVDLGTGTGSGMADQLGELADVLAAS